MAVGVNVAVAVAVGVNVAVTVGVGVNVAVGDGVGVKVAVAVGVGVNVAVAVATAVAVGVGLAVGVGPVRAVSTLFPSPAPVNPATTITRSPIAVPSVRECPNCVIGPVVQLSVTVS